MLIPTSSARIFSCTSGPPLHCILMRLSSSLSAETTPGSLVIDPSSTPACNGRVEPHIDYVLSARELCGDVLERVVDQQLPMVYHGDLVAHVRDLAEDVGAHEDEPVLVLQGLDYAPDFAHPSRVQACGGLVQQHYPRVAQERGGDAILCFIPFENLPTLLSIQSCIPTSATTSSILFFARREAPLAVRPPSRGPLWE